MKIFNRFGIPLWIGIVNWLIVMVTLPLSENKLTIVSNILFVYLHFSIITPIILIIIGIVLNIKLRLSTPNKILLILGYIINLIYLIVYVTLAYGLYQSILHF